MAAEKALVATRAGAAVVTGVAGVIPVPFLGDWLVVVSRRQLVARLLERHGRRFPVGDLAAFYGDGFSWLGLPWRFVKGLILLPVKKLLRSLFVLLALRDVALAVGRTLALSHTLDRMLRTGSFRDDDSAATRRHEAERLRKAFDEAFGGIDERLVRRAVAVLRAQLGRAAGGGGVMELSNNLDVKSFLEELDRRVDHALLGRPLS